MAVELQLQATFDNNGVLTGLKAIDKQVKDTEKSSSESFSKMGIAVQGWGLALDAARKVLGEMKQAFKDVIDEERAMNAITNMVSQFDKTAKGTTDTIYKFADSMKRLGLDDGEVLKGIRQLIPVTKDLDNAQRGVKLAWDVSIATGKDYYDVLDLIQALIAGSQRGLIRAHKELGIEAKTADGALSEMFGKFGGYSQKIDDHRAAVNRLAIAYDDAKKEAASFWLSIFDNLSKTYSDSNKKSILLEWKENADALSEARTKLANTPKGAEGWQEARQNVAALTKDVQMCEVELKNAGVAFDSTFSPKTYGPFQPAGWNAAPKANPVVDTAAAQARNELEKFIQTLTYGDKSVTFVETLDKIGQALQQKIIDKTQAAILQGKAFSQIFDSKAALKPEVIQSQLPKSSLSQAQASDAKRALEIMNDYYAQYVTKTSSTNADLEALTAAHQTRLDLLQKAGQTESLAEENTYHQARAAIIESANRDMEKKARDSYSRMIQDLQNTLSQMGMGLTAAFARGVEDIKKALTETTDATSGAVTHYASAQEAFGAGFKMMGTMSGQLASMMSVNSKADFDRQKDLQKASVAMNLASGIMSIWAQNAGIPFVGVPMATALTALIVAEAGVQMGMINSQKYTPPTTAKGFAIGTGYVPQTGYALLHEGEGVIPASVNAARWNDRDTRSIGNTVVLQVDMSNAFINDDRKWSEVQLHLQDVVERGLVRSL